MTEPFRFSSRHSEFIKLKAEALLSQIQQQALDDDELKMYKVVIQYPDHSAAQSMLQIKPHHSFTKPVNQVICRVEQFVELMQDFSWTEAANIEIFIAKDFSQTETSIMVNLDLSVATASSGNGTGCHCLRMLDEGIANKTEASDENKQKMKSSVILVSNVKKYLIRPL